MARTLVRFVAPMLLFGLLAPPSAVSAAPPQPVCGKAIVGPGTYDWLMCGMPDLDQVRAITGDPSFHSLPNHGIMYCAPTATANVLSYMAAQGFSTGIASKDWEDPANYNEAADELLELGMEMGTTGTGGTGGQAFFDGLQGRIQSSGKVPKFAFQFLTYGAGQGWIAPDPQTLAEAGMDGSLIMAKIGFYDDEADPDDNFEIVKRRVGGHLMTVVGAQSGADGTATLIVRDPGTSYATDTVQTPYANDSHTLTPFTFKGIYLKGGESHTYDGTAMTWDGSETTLFEGFAKVVPNTAWYWRPKTFVGIRPFTLIPDAGPLLERFTVKGRIQDFALSAETIAPAFLKQGSKKVFSLDPFSEAITTIGAVKGASALTFGGAAQDLFVAGRNSIVAFDQDGMKVASRALKTPLADLAFDPNTELLVGLAADGSKIQLLNQALKTKGTQALPGAAEGASELALTPKGGLVLKLPGASEVMKAKKVSALSSLSRSFLGKKKPGRLRVKEISLRGVGQKPATGLAVDDLGNLLVQIGGKTKHFAPNGKQIKGSPFAGERGMPLAFTRSFTNFDPESHPTALDFVPGEGIPAADLVVERTGEEEATVRNLGLAGAGPFVLRVDDETGSTLVEVAFPNGLEAGASQAVEIGCRSIDRTAIVDADGQVPEGDETNNTAAWLLCHI